MPRLLSLHVLGGDGITHSKDGYRFKQVAQISELKGTEDRRLFDAENFHRLPVLFSAHPFIPGTFLKTKTAAFDTKQTTSAARVILSWGPREEGEDEDEDNPTFATLSIINSTTTKESNLDKDGNDIVVAYFQKRFGAGLVVEDRIEQAGVYQRQVNQLTIRAKRRESVDASRIALLLNEKINSAPVAIFPAGTLYATVTAERVLSGLEWDMTYDFRYKPDGWDPTVFATVPGTNAPVANLIQGVGIKTPEVYFRSDFNNLRLGI